MSSSLPMESGTSTARYDSVSVNFSFSFVFSFHEALVGKIGLECFLADPDAACQA